jgi:hypothetical protein
MRSMQFWIPDERFECSPLGLAFLFTRFLFAFGDLFEFLVDLRNLARVQAELGNAALVIDRHRRLIGHRPLDVVDADLIAEDRAGWRPSWRRHGHSHAICFWISIAVETC